MPPALLVSPIGASGVAEAYELHPDALQPPAEHGGGALTSVTLGEARRVVHYAAPATRRVPGAPVACSWGPAPSSPLVDTRHRRRWYGRAVDVRGAALLSDLEVDTQLFARSVQLDNQMGRAWFVTVINGAPADGPWLEVLRRARRQADQGGAPPRRRARVQLEEALLLALLASPAASSPPRSPPAAAAGPTAAAGSRWRRARAAAAETAAPAASALPRKRPWYIDASRSTRSSPRVVPAAARRARHRGWRPPMAIPNIDGLSLALAPLRAASGAGGFFVRGRSCASSTPTSAR